MVLLEKMRFCGEPEWHEAEDNALSTHVQKITDCSENRRIKDFQDMPMSKKVFIAMPNGFSEL